MSELRVILPTRWRPDSLRRFVAGFYDTIELDTALSVVVDADDPAVLEVARDLPADVEVCVLPAGATVVPKVNHAALRHLDDSRVQMYLGDDNVFAQHGWDRMVMEAFRVRGPGFVFVNDLGGRENIIACNMAISTEIVRALGYFDWPGCAHYCVDNIWCDLGRASGTLTYLPDVIIEHLHVIFGKSPDDPLYSQTYATYYASDCAAYQRWQDTGRNDDLARVVKAIRDNR